MTQLSSKSDKELIDMIDEEMINLRKLEEAKVTSVMKIKNLIWLIQTNVRTL